MEDIAHSMATMFDGVDVVPSDFVAALMLVRRDQKKKMQDDKKYNLAAELRNVSCQLLLKYTIPLLIKMQGQIWGSKGGPLKILKQV